MDKGSIANQSTISLIIRATGICWNQVVCKGMAGKQRLCLNMKEVRKMDKKVELYHGSGQIVEFPEIAEDEILLKIECNGIAVSTLKEITLE